jgi:predicted nucleic acid-binding protein
MREDIAGTFVFDAGVLIELLLHSEKGVFLRDALLNNLIDAHTTEFAITEVKYVLCRKIGWKEGNKRAEKLLASGYFDVWKTEWLTEFSAKYKCERGISLADCFILALAKKLGCKALFARREAELEEEIKKKNFDVEIVFVEE